MMFREFKSWARENYEPGTEIKTIWHPVVQKECAEINLENEELKSGKIRIMKQADICKCPFVIMMMEHYRDDGSCKCDDAEHRKYMIKNWEYTEKDFKDIPLRTKAK